MGSGWSQSVGGEWVGSDSVGGAVRIRMVV